MESAEPAVGPDFKKSALDPEKLSMEMIISGMLRVISAHGKNNASDIMSERIGNRTAVKSGDIIPDIEKAEIQPEWINYYRAFVLAAKPEIYHEFSGASIVKAGNGDYKMALEISAVLEGLFPLSPGVILNKALILEDRAAALEKNGHSAEREYAEAEEAYVTALSLKPLLPDALFNAGFFFMRRRNFAQARDCLSAFVSAGEESEIPVDIPMEKIKQARKILKDIINRGLDDTSFQEAHDCISRGNDEKGLLKIREFIEKHPTVWNGWFVLGWALRKLGRYSDGLESFKKALELGGSGSDTWNEMAICLMELGDFKGARKVLEQALREEPENIKIISNLGVLAQKSGKNEEASAFFRTVLELDPDDPLAKHFFK
jgi:tetratricopeptide (TPR) repeat protein